MASSSQPLPNQHNLYKLQRLRASILAFQNKIASLPAKERNTPLNEQFNQLRAEAKSLIKDPGFDKKVPRAITEDIQGERLQKKILPRLFGVITLGVLLALVGLGINSIILDTLIVNILACLVSLTGIFMVIGAFVVFRLNRAESRLSNYGDLYQRCDTLLYQIIYTLNLASPGLADQPIVEIPNLPSVVDLLLDSLYKQATDWQQKLADLEAQRQALGSGAGLDLNVNLDFVRGELQRVKQEIEALNGRQAALLEAGRQPALLPSAVPERPVPPVVKTPPPRAEPLESPDEVLFPMTFEEPTPLKKVDEPSPQVIERASANTMGMPITKDEEPDGSQTETEPPS